MNSNIELTKFFLNDDSLTNKDLMPDFTYTDVIAKLNDKFGKHWAWEIDDERTVQDSSGTCVMTTVTLYTPKQIFTGRSYCKVSQYGDNHLRALYNACLSFIDKSTSGQNRTPANNTGMQPQNMTADQIAAATSGNGNFVNTKADFHNYVDNNGKASDSVPFDAMTDNAVNETSIQPNPQPQQQKPTSFTQEQINAVNEFKRRAEITTLEMFDNWVDRWHKGWGKKNLTPDNVDSFITFANGLLGEY
jgi:hypothetical protein